MSENLKPTPKDIHDELTAIAGEYDQEFRMHRQDAISIIRESKKYIGTIDNEHHGLSRNIYDSKKLTFDAEYILSGAERASKASSILFTLGLTSVKQLVQLPDALLSYTDDEQRAYYDAAAPGDLNEMHHLEYIVRNYGGGSDTSISRSIEYALCDGNTLLYTAQYPISKNKFERVVVAHEQRMLVVPPHIKEESNDDVYDQITYDAAFRSILEVSNNPSLDQAEYELDAALSIRSLLKILHSNAPLPEPNDRLY